MIWPPILVESTGVAFVSFGRRTVKNREHKWRYCDDKESHGRWSENLLTAYRKVKIVFASGVGDPVYSGVAASIGCQCQQ